MTNGRVHYVIAIVKRWNGSDCSVCEWNETSSCVHWLSIHLLTPHRCDFIESICDRQPRTRWTSVASAMTLWSWVLQQQRMQFDLWRISHQRVTLDMNPMIVPEIAGDYFASSEESLLYEKRQSLDFSIFRQFSLAAHRERSLWSADHWDGQSTRRICDWHTTTMMAALIRRNGLADRCRIHYLLNLHFLISLTGKGRKQHETIFRGRMKPGSTMFKKTLVVQYSSHWRCHPLRIFWIILNGNFEGKNYET